VPVPATICFDLDGVLCSQTDGTYEDAVPNHAAIDLVNRLHDQGHRVIIHTSRFMGRAKEDPARAIEIGLELTKRQLATWGVKYDALHMGKPRYDILVDDRAVFFEDDWAKIAANLEAFVAKRR
jgi:CMP-N,N'-diacetyllegionaminic acid synthase